MNNDELVFNDVQRKIEREEKLISGAIVMRNSTNNSAVQSQADVQIREGRRNIEYFESTIRQLQMRRNAQGMGSMSIGSSSNGGPVPPDHDGPQQRGRLGNGQQPSQNTAQGEHDRDEGGYGVPGPGGYSQRSGGHGMMPPRAPFSPPGPGGVGYSKGKPNFSRLGMACRKRLTLRSTLTPVDLIKYDTPYLGPRIQLMLSQLEFKLSVEKQYKDGIEKIMGSYNIDGDRKIRAEAQGRRTESMNKIKILERSLKRYSDLHVDMESTTDAADGIRAFRVLDGNWVANALCR